MSTDTLRDLSQNKIANRLGVPRIPRLRRYRPGQPLLGGPALVSDGPLAGTVRAVLADADVAESEADSQDRLGAIIVDASGARSIDDLAHVRDILRPAVRRLMGSGRLIVLGPVPDPGAGVEATAVAQALDAMMRSAAKELRGGATGNLLQVAPGAEGALASPLAFLLSARSAFVSGQAIRVGPAVGPLAAAGAPSGDGVADGRVAGRRVAVVTGAARGIGAAIADVLAREGVRVVAIDVPAAGEALAGVANRIGGVALQLDITAPDAPARIVEHIRSREGRLDVLVHNAGITRDKLLANMEPARWDSVLAVNLRAQLAINEAVLSGGVLSTTGRIVCISSTSGIAGNRGQTNYAASKAGVIGMVRALAPRVAESGVTVNAVAPGFIETEMTARMPLAMREAARRVNTLRQGGLPVDVAEAVAWLAQADSAGVTGQVVRVCGQNLVGA